MKITMLLSISTLLWLDEELYHIKTTTYYGRESTFQSTILTFRIIQDTFNKNDQIGKCV